MILLSEVKVYAHRGASGYALENTWDAFIKACELGVGIELDVQITKDGVVVVYHDDNLRRLTGINEDIDTLDYEDIKELRVGRRWMRKFQQHQIPLAYEVFQWAKKKKIPLNVELKGSFAKNPKGPQVLAAMLEGMEDIHLSSFNSQLLQEMKQLMPSTEMAWIVKKNKQLAYSKEMDWVDSIHLHKRLLGKPMWTDILKLNKKVRLYGILGSESLTRLLEPQMIGIITDYPDRVKRKMASPFIG
ncbi:glycerophosphodiester phosphodiesterase family protein [Planococcus donghaensis]|uniref:glycerophosphodiester phosphodiesterase n=1 Tax=Planococcus donghaensis TaxID=414778 RepID=UPI000587BAF0|nr:glycerophosphodiester phosphodiesterase family protein [Planococcus donghaensis]